MTLKNRFDFSGKSVVLTGATGGLGRPITLAFAQAGANIALWDINEESLSKLADEMKGRRGKVLTAKVDLLVPQEVETFVRFIREKYQKIDILVNLVGGIIRKPSID